MKPPRLFTFFIHLPKTAGTSFKTACIQALGPRLAWWVHKIPPDAGQHGIDYYTELQGLIPRIGVDLEMCGGHVTFSMLPPEIRDQALLISMLREPVARALSFFAYLWDHPQHPLAQKTSGMTLYDALQVPAFRWAVQNQQCRHLFGGLGQRQQILEGTAVKYLIGKTDQLPEFLDAVADCGGPRLVVRSSDNQSRSDYREILASQPRYHEAIELLRELNGDDTALFESFPTLLLSSALRSSIRGNIPVSTASPGTAPGISAGSPARNNPRTAN